LLDLAKRFTTFKVGSKLPAMGVCGVLIGYLE